MTSISLRNIQRDLRQGHPGHQDVDLEIAPGEFCVSRPVGLRQIDAAAMVAGIEDATAGDLAIGGVRMDTNAYASGRWRWSSRAGACIPHMSVHENMAFSLRQAMVDKKRDRPACARRPQILQLEPLLERMPRALSGGQRQRVAIGFGRSCARRTSSSSTSRSPTSTPRLCICAPRSRACTKVQPRQRDLRDARPDRGRWRWPTRSSCVRRSGRWRSTAASPRSVRRWICITARANRFVAAFLGSPRMNFIEARVVGSDAAGLTLQIGAGEGRHRAGRPCVGAESRHQTVTLGLRPEHMHPVARRQRPNAA